MRTPTIEREDEAMRLHHLDLAHMTSTELEIETHRALTMMTTVDKRRDPSAWSWWSERCVRTLRARTPERRRA